MECFHAAANDVITLNSVSQESRMAQESEDGVGSTYLLDEPVDESIWLLLVPLLVLLREPARQLI